MNDSDSATDCLSKYCSARGIIIHPSLQPKRVPGCGLGVYAGEDIERGKQLIHVPTKQIFTTSNVPESFLGQDSRETLAVHAQLAAFFAFGDREDLEPYRPWIDTWPVFEDFYDNMPLFWGDDIIVRLTEHLDQVLADAPEAEVTEPVSKRRKVSRNSEVLPGLQSTPRRTDDWSISARSLGTVRGQTAQMISKLVSHITSVSKALPHLMLLEGHSNLTKFLHAWCLINTRCFYYVPFTSSVAQNKKLKLKAPADPNEAMALCPFMDLFNHMAPPESTVTSSMNGRSAIRAPCKVKANATGFTATTTSEIEADSEISFSYGPHTNDTLWSEYGFLLPDSSNSTDAISLDEIILQNFTDEQRTALQDNEYLGIYTLFHDGSVCYRTEMAAWLVVLGIQAWTLCVEEGLDPEDLPPVNAKAAQAATRLDNGLTTTGKQQHFEIIKTWLVATQDQARKDGESFKSMKDSEVYQLFQTLSIIEDANHRPKDLRMAVAKRRHGMCIDRCEQMQALAWRGVDAASTDATNE